MAASYGYFPALLGNHNNSFLTLTDCVSIHIFYHIDMSDVTASCGQIPETNIGHRCIKVI